MKRDIGDLGSQITKAREYLNGRSGSHVQAIAARQPTHLTLKHNEPVYLSLPSQTRQSPCTVIFKSDKVRSEFEVFVSLTCPMPSASKFDHAYTSPDVVKIEGEKSRKEFDAHHIYIGIFATTEIQLEVRARFAPKPLPVL